MHYLNGREVKIGDTVIGSDWSGLPAMGEVIDVCEGCQITVKPLSINYTGPAKKFLHIDDFNRMTPEDMDKLKAPIEKVEVEYIQPTVH